MSDSELSDAEQHGPQALEEELRKVVRDIYVSGNLEELTVKRVRAAAEKSLGLEDGFYKQDDWKERSKNVIESAAKNQDQPPANFSPPRKRKTEAAPEPSKRQKKGSETAKPRAKQPKPKVRVSSSSELSEPEDSPADKVEGRDQSEQEAPPPKKEAKAAEASESELSELIDDDAPPVRRPKKAAKGSKGAKGAKADKADKAEKPAKVGRGKAKKEPLELDPDAAEIKRLQGWLIKCGIRKMWVRELKPYDTPKAKLQHLRGMLSDAGMAGRYSVEKANQIREARELQADLEAVQEGAKYWGKQDSGEDEEEQDVGARPKRRLAKGLQELAAFGDSESD